MSDEKKDRNDANEKEEEEDAWQVVSSKRSARGVKHRQNIQNAKTAFRFGEDDDKDDDDDETKDESKFEALVEDTTRKLERAKRDVQSSSFFQTRVLNAFREDDLLRERANSCTKMVVLGTGSFRHSATSRYQMMLAILLSEDEELTKEMKKVCVYDPAFGKVDVEVLKRMKVVREGVSVEAWSAERSKRFVENSEEEKNENVFAYMPHCEADLYEEILEHRWEVESSENESDDPMGRMLLCGNKFSNYYERWSFANNSRLTTKTKRKPNRVVALGNQENECIEKEISLEGETKESKFSLHNGTFNDTAVHVFKNGFVRPFKV